MAGVRAWVLEAGAALDPQVDGGRLVGYAVLRFPGDL